MKSRYNGTWVLRTSIDLQTALPAAEAVTEKLAHFCILTGVQELAQVVERIGRLEADGWDLGDADATFYLQVLKSLRRYRPLFDTQRYSVLSRGTGADVVGDSDVEACVKIQQGGEVLHAVSDGPCPLSALHRALRKALAPVCPHLADVNLASHAVRVLDGMGPGPAGHVRVLVHSQDSSTRPARSWDTVGVARNVVAAAWMALVDAFEYKHLLDTNCGPPPR